ncbi:MAG: GNAT family N-acetyltransferase, partial [Actinomycetota bacterium]|nr:GNAT family N-acetyltransferase [Actinomycetota bacterium]
MFERFTQGARRAVVLAQEEARVLEHNYIGTEHLLLGLMAEDDGVGARALEALDVSLPSVRVQVEEIIGRGKTKPVGHIPFTPRAKKVLELSLLEARELGDQHIGTEHLLLGLVREGEGVAAQVLSRLGVRSDVIRSAVNATRSGREARPHQTAVLRPMLPDEFVTYLEWAIDDYAAELERNGKATGEAATLASRASFDSLLSDGLATVGHVLLVAADPDNGQRVGVLWFGPSTDDSAMAWIYDITVDEDRRRQGWGRAIMRAFEGEAR